MTLHETALTNESKEEMKLWREIYTDAMTKSASSHSMSVFKANEAISTFNETFNEYGNVI